MTPNGAFWFLKWDPNGIPRAEMSYLGRFLEAFFRKTQINSKKLKSTQKKSTAFAINKTLLIKPFGIFLLGAVALDSMLCAQQPFC